jgi:hypothetical protein
LKFDLCVHALKDKWIPPIDSSAVRRKKTSNAPIEVLAPGSSRPVADAMIHFAQKNKTPNHNNAAGTLMAGHDLPAE